jgi:hypothetical protein
MAKQRKSAIGTRLMQVVLEEMPTAKDREILTQMVQKMTANCEPVEIQKRALVGALLDGLAHGNWPHQMALWQQENL